MTAHIGNLRTIECDYTDIFLCDTKCQQTLHQGAYCARFSITAFWSVAGIPGMNIQENQGICWLKGLTNERVCTHYRVAGCVRLQYGLADGRRSSECSLVKSLGGKV